MIYDLLLAVNFFWARCCILQNAGATRQIKDPAIMAVKSSGGPWSRAQNRDLAEILGTTPRGTRVASCSKLRLWPASTCSEHERSTRGRRV